MIMADVLKFFLLVTGALIVLVGYWLAAEALAPRLVERARDLYSGHRARIALLGVAIGGPLAVIGFKLVQGGSGPAKAVGFAMLSGAVLGGLLGSAGLCRRIGEGLPSTVDGGAPWRRVLRGAVVLSVTFLLPFIGWFLVMPLVLASGFGAALCALWSERQARAEALAEPATEAAGP